MEDFEEFKLKKFIDDPMWNGYTGKEKEIIEKLVFSIYCAKAHGLSAYAIDCTGAFLLKSGEKLFNRRIVYECEDCEAMCIPHCISCGSSQLYMTKTQKLWCMSCGTEQEDRYIMCCESGHESRFSTIDPILEFHLQQSCFVKVIETLREVFSIDLSDEEYFYIQDGQVVLQDVPNKGFIININEIPELKEIQDIAMDQSERDTLHSRYDSIKEKCKKHSNKACSECQISERVCIMNLFMIFGFRPNPHHNNEFGDVNFKVDFLNKEHRLVGIAKSKSKEANITVSSTPGREIIQQVVTMTHDTRADIIAVICPTRLHPQLEAELEHIARHMNKKIVLLEDEFMIKLLKKNGI